MDPSFAIIRLDNRFAERALHFSNLGEDSLLLTALAQLMASARRGDLCLPLVNIKESAQRLIEEQEKLSSFIRIDRGNLYLEKNWTIERIIESEIERLSANQGFSSGVSRLPLNEQQRQAVAICLQNRLSMLIGGPGTGKTFTAAAIVEAFDPKKEKRILLAAPTGKAAEHLGHSIFKATGRHLASATLHKWLKIGGWPPWPKEGDVLDADLLLVDECSMIDAPLFATLLKSIPTQCYTVLMGDPNQLNPIGIGSIFADLVHSSQDSMGKARLTQSMRTENQQILFLAEQVLNAKLPKEAIVPWPDTEREFYHYLKNILQSVLGKPTEQKPNPDELYQKLSQKKILNCLRQGPRGVDAINQFFLEEVRRNAKADQWWWMPIMITSNDERTGLSNGEMGIFMQRQGDHGSGMAYFPRKQRELSAMALPNYEPAFCTSVHKSQGTEYDEVIVIVPVGSENFGREMLYTAITRARQNVALLASEEVLFAMIGKSLVKHSGLS